MDVISENVPENSIFEEFQDKDTMAYDHFVEFLESHCHLKLSQHAMLVVARQYAIQAEPKITYDLVLKLSRNRLQKLNFDRYDELKKALSQCAANANEILIDPADVYRVCIAVGLPLKNDLLTALLQKVPKPDGRVDYKSFVDKLNSKAQTVEEEVSFIPDSTLTQPDAKESGWFGHREFHYRRDEIQSIDIAAFKSDLWNLKHANSQSPTKSADMSSSRASHNS